MSNSLQIKPVKTSKNKLKELYPEMCASGDIPSPNTCTIIVGSAGSGKSVLINNLVSNPCMWGGYFEPENIYLLSETGSSDDVVKDLNIPEDNVFEDLQKGIKKMEKIMKVNKSIIKNSSHETSPQVLLIYDDCINNKELLKNNFFKKTFVQNRHLNLTIVCSVQHYKSIPPMARNQCMNTILFQSNQATFEQFAEIFTPPGYSKKEFMQILNMATKDKYSFIYMNKALPHKTRYRKNFDQIINLDRLQDSNDKEDNENENEKET